MLTAYTGNHSLGVSLPIALPYNALALGLSLVCTRGCTLALNRTLT